MKRIILLMCAGGVLFLFAIMAADWNSNRLFSHFDNLERKCELLAVKDGSGSAHNCDIESILEIVASKHTAIQSEIFEAYSEMLAFDESYILIIPAALLLSFLISWFFVYVLYRQRESGVKKSA